MSGMVYRWREGAHVSARLDAQACGDFIAALPSSKPADVVAASRDRNAPTHAHFSWAITGTEAKQRVWEQEAGQLVRAVVVVREDKPEAPPLPAFVSVIQRDAEERSYMPLYSALSDEDYRLQVLAEAKSAFLALRRRYADLTELAAVFEAIDQLTLPEAA